MRQSARPRYVERGTDRGNSNRDHEQILSPRVTMVQGRRVHAMPRLTLKPGHVQPVWAGHPWVYEQAILRIEGGAVAGDEVEVIDPRGNFIGRGFYSPGSAIPVRVLVRDRDTPIDG